MARQKIANPADLDGAEEETAIGGAQADLETSPETIIETDQETNPADLDGAEEDDLVACVATGLGGALKDTIVHVRKVHLAESVARGHVLDPFVPTDGAL